MGHGHDEYADLIPKDHTIYKPETCPDLVKLKERLAKEGLKDPWMRNEVYRYQFNTTPVPMRILEVAGGFKSIGLGMAIGAAGALYWKWSQDDHHHEAGGAEHH